jgi:hypothetical protein
MRFIVHTVESTIQTHLGRCWYADRICGRDSFYYSFHPTSADIDLGLRLYLEVR